MSRTPLPQGVLVKARDLKPGQVIIANATYYKAWKLVRVERDEGVILLASRRDPAGEWLTDAVALLLRNDAVPFRAVSL